MRQDKHRQVIPLFEVVELYHQPSGGIALFHCTAQVGKVVHDENLTAGLQRHLLDAADNRLFKVCFQQRIAVKRYPIQLFRKGIEVSVFIGIAELELFVGQLEVQIQYIVSPCDAVGYLYGKDGLAHIGIGKEAGQFPLVPETVPQRTGRGQQRCFEYSPVGSLDTHHTDTLRHTVLHLGSPCKVAMYQADIVLVLFHDIYQLRGLGLRRWEEDKDSPSSSSDNGTGFFREDSSHLSSSSR